jgi:hypothetical protein
MTGVVHPVHRNSLKKLIRQAEVHMSSEDLRKLEVCLNMSDIIYAGIIDGEYACCWGLVPPSMMSDKAYLWLQTTAKVEEHKFLFVRHSQRCVEKMLESYEELVGFCSPENKAAIRWIEWLGGEFKKPFAGRVDFSIRRKAPIELQQVGG